MSERAAFERWARGQGRDVRRHIGGEIYDYEDPLTDWARRGWQAALRPPARAACPTCGYIMRDDKCHDPFHTQGAGDGAGPSQPPAADEVVVANAVLAEREACALVCERIADERFHEHGTYEPDTNASYYGGGLADEYELRDEEDNSCATAIRARSVPIRPTAARGERRVK